MGLLDMLVPGVGDNPFYKAFDQNRGKIVGAFSGMAGAGNDPRMALQGFVGGLQHGVGVDQENAIIRQKQAEQQAAIEQEKQKQNATIQYLQQQGRADLIAAINGGMPVAEAWKMALSPADKANSESFFGNGVPIKNPDGSISYGQFGNQGSFNVPKLPDGSRFLTPVEQLNTGTGFTAVDKFGNPTGGFTPIDNQGAAYDKSFGEGAGKAAIDRISSLPQAVAKADNMLGTIDGILNDPALDSSTGWLSWLQGVPGTDQYRFGQRALQLQGQAFLQAFESLKGGGQITQVEGEKATQAIGRLSTSQSPQDYRAALDELKGIINAAKIRAQQQAAGLVQTPYNGGGMGAPAPANPADPLGLF